ncbi:conserved hypothetical protein [Paecilomyces variotii No. 5]|uniref:Uncharacterized protein n=1 Tax=Byssochlamys spectabilis (strain No. 5 / NBRC 109023) TaxID=1356009 RepID=V5FF02_BYSSN|nr:conserved hypothetical protein [Paecilomyces variotii No. 5]
MVRGDKPKGHPDSSIQQPRTPANLTTRHKVASARPATTTKAKKRAQSPSYSVQSSFRSRRSDGDSEWRQQPTLTQIDFVTRTQESGSNEELEYIQDNDDKPARRKESEVIELDDDSEGGDATFRLTPFPRVRRARAIRFDDEVRSTPGQSRSRAKSTGGHTDNGRKKRKSSTKSSGGEGTRKSNLKPGKKDKTLTQMDFVRRFCVIDSSDDDLNLNYIGDDAKDNAEMGASKLDLEDVNATPKDEQVSRRGPPDKKRKLNDHSDGTNENYATRTDETGTSQKTLFPAPVTPQKPRRTEIPSSQSPESPGFAVISSSQFTKATATRSPLKLMSPNSTHSPSKVIQNPYHPMSKFSHSPVGVSLQMKSAAGDSAACSLPPPQERDKAKPSPSPSEPKLKQESPRYMSEEKHKPGEEPSSAVETNTPMATGKVVIYETDADTDYSDLEEDTMLKDSNSGHIPAENSELDNAADSEPNPDVYNSDDLLPPQVPNSGTDLEGGDTYTSDFNASSQASIYYKRQPRSTQFPEGPVPLLNTQKLTELFPRYDETQQARVEISSLPPSPAKESVHHPSSPQTPKQTFTQTQTQTQSQSEQRPISSTQLVPESSPLVPCTDVRNFTTNTQSQSDHPVVLVESSQPVDKLHRLASSNQVTSQNGVIPASRWLTDSVMESIPPPPRWISSQDSIGEPYSLPES